MGATQGIIKRTVTKIVKKKYEDRAPKTGSFDINLQEII